jgi:hypothetical protein
MAAQGVTASESTHPVCTAPVTDPGALHTEAIMTSGSVE